MFISERLEAAEPVQRDDAATDPDAATASLNPTDIAGVFPQANWNNLELNTGSSTTLVKADGTASTASVSWTSNNTWRSTTGNNAFPAGPDRVLMAGYLDTLDTTAGAASVTISNIDASLQAPTYDVYVYLLGDSGEAFRGGGYTINNGTTSVLKYGSTMGGPTMHVEDPGTDIDNTIDGTYLRFRRLTGSSFTLTADAFLAKPPGRNDGFRAPINAVQIHARPAPGDVNGDGNVNLTDFHVIRGNFFKTGQTDEQGDLVGVGGVVDFADYREWKLRASAGDGAAADAILAGVPEPASIVLLAMGASLAALARRRTSRK